MITFPTITTERLILREITDEDVTAKYYEFLSNPEVREQMGLTPHVSQKSMAIDEIDYYDMIYRSKKGIRWGITLKEDNNVIGSCGLLNRVRHHARAKFGIELHPSYWNKGIEEEASKAVLTYGFTTYELHRIEAIIEPDKLATQQILKKIGFLEEGRLRQYQYFAGSYHDVLMYSILKTES